MPACGLPLVGQEVCILKTRAFHLIDALLALGLLLMAVAGVSAQHLNSAKAQRRLAEWRRADTLLQNCFQMNPSLLLSKPVHHFDALGHAGGVGSHFRLEALEVPGHHWTELRLTLSWQDLDGQGQSRRLTRILLP